VAVELLDGHNNSGFSGGPIYYISNQEICVRGVISGYRFKQSHLYDKNNNELEFFIKENSGIIRFYSIKYVLEILESI